MPTITTSQQTPESLEEIAKRLDEISAKLRATGATIKLSNLSPLPVKHFKSLSNGMRGFNSFCSAVEEAIDLARMESGEFGRTQPDTSDRETTTYGKKRQGKTDTKPKGKSP